MIQNKLYKFISDKTYTMHKILIFLIFIFTIIHLLFFKINTNNDNHSFQIKNGATLDQVADVFYEKNLIPSKWRFKLLFYLTANQNNIKKGNYSLNEGSISIDLIRMITQGKELTYPITFVEGQTVKQVFNLIKKNKNIKHTIKNFDEKKIIKAMGIKVKNLEGMVYADTYYFVKNTSDIELLKIAFNQLDKKLTLAWKNRSKNLPYKSAYEALVMASIIEKEVTFYDEANLVSGVFVNRLNIGMPLQSDPTVIYGIKNFDGNIRRKDLRKDHPHNTYTRKKLPPTPISIVGYDSIKAALNPADTKALYFVAKGNQRHKFSKTLDEHNNAVNLYQRKKRKK